jgi:LysR family transcriptional regulator, hydrogen peroxide-inducible genes activator
MAVTEANGCTVMPLPKEQTRRIGFARLKSGARFKTLTEFTKWLRAEAESIAKPTT